MHRPVAIKPGLDYDHLNALHCSGVILFEGRINPMVFPKLGRMAHISGFPQTRIALKQPK